MGRVTYEEMAGFWPTSTDDYAAPMNEIPKVVFSRTLAEATWPESSIARGDLAEEIAALRAQPGGEIIAWGGGGTALHIYRPADRAG
jgi:dihydrofolate reductase